MAIDAHFHAWRLDRGDYGWLTPALSPIYRDVAVQDWQQHALAWGVTGGVLVQAAPTEAETHWLLAQAEAHPMVLGVVGWVDALADDAPARIQSLARHPKLKGLRPMLQDIEQTDWVLQPALAPFFQAMVAHGLVFDALVQPRHLPVIDALATRYPTLPIVVDHGAKPAIASGQWADWADGMTGVARHPQVVCKLSGLLTEAGGVPADAVLARWGAQLLEAFGPHRLLWGSDWPVLELAARYDHWHGAVALWLAQRPVAEQQAIWGGNAQRVYGLV